MSESSKKGPRPHNSHSHSHAHGHSHSHGGSGVVGRMKWALVLNLCFAIIELVGGILTNSVAILSDALHDFGDAIAMLTAILLEKFSHKQSDNQFSYGYRRFSTLGAVITGFILIVGSVIIVIEAVPRLITPQQPHADGMIWLALLGVAVNGYAAYRVSKGGSLNERMLMWHMIEDVLGWVLVLAGAITMKFFDIPQLDAGLAIVLALWILFNVFRNLQDAFKVFLMATPSATSVTEVEDEIKSLPEVEEVHHAHLWSLDGENHIFTAHVVLQATLTSMEVQAIKEKIKKLTREYGIVEATIETELAGMTCVDPVHK